MSGDRRDESEGYLEIVIRLRPRDPRIGAESEPLEATRDELNDVATKIICSRVVSESDVNPPDDARSHTMRAKELSASCLKDVEEPLREIASRAATAVSTLAVEAATRGAAGFKRHYDQLRHNAQSRAQGATRKLSLCWQKYMPTKEDIVKDVIKYAFRAILIYAVYQSYFSMTS